LEKRFYQYCERNLYILVATSRLKHLVSLAFRHIS
jgi:hypothetical protein